MSELGPVPPQEFDEQAVAKALKTRSATVRDVAYGEGHQFSVGRGGLRLEIFPRTGVTRLTGQDVRIELFGNAVSRVGGSGVEFERVQPGQEANLTVVSDAGVVFTFITGGEPSLSARQGTPETPRTADQEPARTSIPAAPDRGPAIQPDESTEPPRPVRHAGSTPPEPGPAGIEGRERGTLVTFVGRLGKNPFVSGKKGVPHIRMSVGEHYLDEEGAERIRWHEVWAASANSDAVKRMSEEGTLRQGVEVSVRGYRHERGPDAQGRQQRPFIRAFQIDLTKKPSPKRDGW